MLLTPADLTRVIETDGDLTPPTSIWNWRNRSSARYGGKDFRNRRLMRDSTLKVSVSSAKNI